MEEHTNESVSSDGPRLRPYRCKLCGKKWEVRSKLEIHVRTHTGSKPFDCDVCGRSFNVLSNLRRHIKTVHTAVKPYNCRYCGKTFNQNSNLKRHERTHVEEEEATDSGYVSTFPFAKSFAPSGTAALLLAAEADSSNNTVPAADATLEMPTENSCTSAENIKVDLKGLLIPEAVRPGNHASLLSMSASMSRPKSDEESPAVVVGGDSEENSAFNHVPVSSSSTTAAEDDDIVNVITQKQASSSVIVSVGAPKPVNSTKASITSLEKKWWQDSTPVYQPAMH